MVVSRSPKDWPSLVRRRVRVVLAEHEISASEVARRLGRSQSYVAHRLSGRQSFDVTDLDAIATLLGIQPTDLIPAKPQDVAA